MAENNNLDEDIVVTLNIEGEDIDFEVLTIFEVEGNDYVAIYPASEGPNPEDIELDHIYLYPYIEEEDGNYYIDDFSTDEEYDKVEKAFVKLLEEAES